MKDNSPVYTMRFLSIYGILPSSPRNSPHHEMPGIPCVFRADKASRKILRLFDLMRRVAPGRGESSTKLTTLIGGLVGGLRVYSPLLCSHFATAFPQSAVIFYRTHHTQKIPGKFWKIVKNTNIYKTLWENC